MPCALSLSASIVWSRASKAFLRSMKTAMGALLLFMCLARSSTSSASAIAVDFFRQRSYCLLLSRFSCSMNKYSCSWNRDSRIFPGTGRRDTGRRSFGVLGCGTFGYGMTVAVFHVFHCHVFHYDYRKKLFIIKVQEAFYFKGNHSYCQKPRVPDKSQLTALPLQTASSH